MKPFFQDRPVSRIFSFHTLDYAPHLHNALEIGFLSEGKSVLQIEGKNYPVKAGDFFAVFPDLIHSYKESEGAKGTLAILTLEDLSPFQKKLMETVPLSPVLTSKAWKESDLELIFSLAQKENSGFEKEIRTGFSRVITGKILSLLTFEKRQNTTKSTLREILSYLSAHKGENLTRKSIARNLGLSESTVSHAFSEGLKTTLTQYLNHLRLEESATLLKETSLSVTQVAEQAGFGSLRSFNRVFREAYGSSPSQYRKKN